MPRLEPEPCILTRSQTPQAVKAVVRQVRLRGRPERRCDERHGIAVPHNHNGANCVVWNCRNHRRNVGLKITTCEVDHAHARTAVRRQHRRGLPAAAGIADDNQRRVLAGQRIG